MSAVSDRSDTPKHRGAEPARTLMQQGRLKWQVETTLAECECDACSCWGGVSCAYHTGACPACTPDAYCLIESNTARHLRDDTAEVMAEFEKEWEQWLNS